MYLYDTYLNPIFLPYEHHFSICLELCGYMHTTGAKSGKCERKKSQQKDCGYWKMYLEKGRKEPSATTVLHPRASTQAGAHCATQYTWNALPLHPAKPALRPPPSGCLDLPLLYFP